MSKLSKQSIIDAYNQLTQNHGGKVVGEGIFKRETEISPYYWRGGYWRSWSAFQKDAGHTPNKPTEKIDDKILFRRLAELILEIEDIPTQADLRLKRKEDESFPSDDAFRRLGEKHTLMKKLSVFCKDNLEYEVVSEIIANYFKDNVSESKRATEEDNIDYGFVYLMKSGPDYTIGKSNHTGRRSYEHERKLPKKIKTIHTIKTDDPFGVESYWHNRFKAKRTETDGSWYRLSASDVKSFKRWKSIF